MRLTYQWQPDCSTRLTTSMAGAGMRTVAEIRRAERLAIPYKKDSDYKPVVRCALLRARSLGPPRFLTHTFACPQPDPQVQPPQDPHDLAEEPSLPVEAKAHEVSCLQQAAIGADPVRRPRGRSARRAHGTCRPIVMDPKEKGQFKLLQQLNTIRNVRDELKKDANKRCVPPRPSEMRRPRSLRGRGPAGSCSWRRRWRRRRPSIAKATARSASSATLRTRS